MPPRRKRGEPDGTEILKDLLIVQLGIAGVPPARGLLYVSVRPQCDHHGT